MRYIYAVIVLVAIAGSVGSAPCWDDTNTCGDTPLCGPGQPPSGVQPSECYHIYCETDSTCPTQAATKKVLKSIRNKYRWSEGFSLVSCVSAPTILYIGACCNCNEPGVMYLE